MTSRPTKVSTPAKVILMGEHAAVYGRPALVAALGLRLQVGLASGGEAGVFIELPELQHAATADWPGILELTARMRRRWETYAAEPTRRRFQDLRSDDPAAVVKLALGEAALALGDDPADPACPTSRLHLRIDSEIPIGSGFGSSAATAVAVVTAYLARRGHPGDWDRILRLALEVERRQHGLPSGIDSTTVFHGGVLRARKIDDDELHHEPLAARSEALHRMRIYDSGRPLETTGMVVAEVRSRRDRDPAAFEETLDAMEDATERFHRTLVHEGDGADALQPIRDFQACLEELGVVPATVRRRVREIERLGGAAKISGAGALSGNGAGSLIVYHPDPQFHEGGGALSELVRYEAVLGVEGVRLESAA